jgi:hypothetical protein
MSQVVDLLNEMRGRLGMYVGTTSMTKFAAFLRGYDYALYKQGVDELNTFFGGFQDWVRNRFHDPAHTWDNIILAHSNDETEAMERFWNLLDEYLQEHNGSPQARAATTKSSR